MIEIKIGTYKYREYKGIEIRNFESEQKAEAWIQEMEDYTNEVKAESSECGEDLSKWSAALDYKGKRYWIYWWKWNNRCKFCYSSRSWTFFKISRIR